jgi:hypothetical protein
MSILVCAGRRGQTRWCPNELQCRNCGLEKGYHNVLYLSCYTLYKPFPADQRCQNCHQVKDDHFIPECRKTTDDAQVVIQELLALGVIFDSVSYYGSPQLEKTSPTGKTL